jgi:hypothetical protein
MKFKLFLTEGSYSQKTDEILKLCESLIVRSKDNTIKKISRNQYKFSVDSFHYIFGIVGEDLGDFKIYNVYYTDEKGSIERKNELTVKQAKKVIEKVITCMIYFINDFKPDVFIFNTDDDERLFKFYSVIIMKIYKREPFINYTIININNGYKFIKNGQNEQITSSMFPIEQLLKEI